MATLASLPLHRLFRAAVARDPALLKMVEKEFGFQSHGGLELPCEVVPLTRHVAAAGRSSEGLPSCNASARFVSSEASLEAEQTDVKGFKGHDMLAPFTAGWQSNDLHPLEIDKSEVLTNGIEVKLQRNALSVIEAPTGLEEDDDIECENMQWNGSDMGQC